MKFKSLLVDAGLVKPDDPPPLGSVPMVNAPPQPTSVPPLQVVPAGNADATMVNNLKTSVLGASPIIGQFMRNVDIARGSFPNDESACMKASLAFTGVDKATLLGELDRTVAAAFLQAQKGIEGERKDARDAAVGDLGKQLETADADIKRMERQIADLQQSVAQKRAAIGQLQGKVRDAEADLQRQDNTVNASFAQVEQYIASLKQTFGRL